jgi:hypothetical protein
MGIWLFTQMKMLSSKLSGVAEGGAICFGSVDLELRKTRPVRYADASIPFKERIQRVEEVPIFRHKG